MVFLWSVFGEEVVRESQRGDGISAGRVNEQRLPANGILGREAVTEGLETGNA